MVDEETRKKIHVAVGHAFEKWALRNYERVIREFGEGDDERQREVSEDFWDEDAFLVRRVRDIGFYRYTLKEIRSNKLIAKRRKHALEACIASMISSLGTSISELLAKTGEAQNGKGRSENDKKTKRDMQRTIYEKLAESFFEHKPDDRFRTEDERVPHISSVFAPVTLPKTEQTEEALWMLYLERMDTLLRQNVAQAQLIHFSLSFSLPEFLQDMIDFRTDCLALLPPKSAKNEVAQYLESQVMEFTPLFLQFYWHFSSIVAVEYFRHRKKEGRKALLSGEYLLRYDQAEARKARELLGKLFGSPAHASLRLSDAAAYFSMMGLHQISIVLYEDVRTSKDESLINQAITSENIAIEYRWLRNYKLMLRYAKEALQLYGNAEQQYRYCVCLKNIGEAEGMLGFKDRARECFEEAELRSESLRQSDHFSVLFNIAMAHSRIGDRKGELDYLKKSLVACPEDQTERILWINERMNQLTSI